MKIRFVVITTLIFLSLLTAAENFIFRMNSKRALHRCIKLIDGNVLVTGGVRTLWPFPWPLSSAELFITQEKRFVRLPSMNTYHTEHTLTLLPNGNVIVAGGNRGRTIEFYNVQKNRFYSLRPPLTSRAGHTAHLIGEKLFLIGGYQVELTQSNISPQGLVPLNNYEIYNLSTQTSQLIEYPQLFSHLMMHRSLQLPNGNILIIGGIGNRRNVLELDTTTLIFTLRGTLQVPREDHAALFLDDTHILISGGTDATSKTTNSIEIFNLEENISTLLSASLHEPREDHHMILLPHQNVAFIGGEINKEPDVILKSLEVLDLKTQEMKFYQNAFPRGISDHDATLLNTGEILVTGGETIRGSMSSQAELLSIF